MTVWRRRISTTPHATASRLLPGKAGAWRRLLAKLARKRVRRRLGKYGFIAANAVLLLVVIAFVLQAHSSGTATVSAVTADSTPVNPLDQVSSADIALTVSNMTGMTEQTAVKNQSESDDIELATAPVADNVVSRPQVLASTFKSNKDIQTYTVQAGDTVSSLASRFNVTSDSIRWSNNLTGNTVVPGTKLLIPPVGYSGIVYTVKAGDTLASIAQKYKADQATLTAANDAEITGIQVGEQIIIPNGQQPVQTYSSNYYSSGFAWGTSAVYGYNGYDYGYCTWWVASRREQVGKPLPSNLGNASSWPYIARLAGLPEGNVPRQYAAAVTSTAGEGHVVFVESVNPDGSIVISEMNHLGWAVKDTETIDAATASHYIYIY